MAKPKHPSEKQPSLPVRARADRPYMPGYGLPAHAKGILPWSHVSERMEKAANYWIGTTDPAGRPHATPVWGIWYQDKLYFGGGAETRRSRNLAKNAAVVVHLESGSDVVILQGEARPARDLDIAVATELSAISKSKYGYGSKPEEYGREGVYVVEPRIVFAWTNLAKDATRWRFDSES